MANKEAKGDAHLIVVGASAGGVEALLVLVGSLKSDFPAPVVLAQHVDPNRTSCLPSILERRTSLPVLLVEKDLPLDGRRPSAECRVPSAECRVPSAECRVPSSCIVHLAPSQRHHFVARVGAL